jgi:hypothetical protein
MKQFGHPKQTTLPKSISNSANKNFVRAPNLIKLSLLFAATSICNNMDGQSFLFFSLLGPKYDEILETQKQRSIDLYLHLSGCMSGDKFGMLKSSKV